MPTLYSWATLWKPTQLHKITANISSGSSVYPTIDGIEGFPTESRPAWGYIQSQVATVWRNCTLDNRKIKICDGQHCTSFICGQVVHSNSEHGRVGGQCDFIWVVVCLSLRPSLTIWFVCVTNLDLILMGFYQLGNMGLYRDIMKKFDNDSNPWKLIGSICTWLVERSLVC